MKRAKLSVAIAVVATLGLTACGGDAKPSPPPPPPDRQLNGVYQVHGIFRHRKAGQPCDAKDVGYKDIRQGTTVQVRDSSGKRLGTATLGAGTLRRTILHRDDCIFRFSLRVPERDAYQIEVGARGAVSFTKQDLERKGWEAVLVIGNYAAGI